MAKFKVILSNIQWHIWNFVKYLWKSAFAKIVNSLELSSIFGKTLHHRSFKGRKEASDIRPRILHYPNVHLFQIFWKSWNSVILLKKEKIKQNSSFKIMRDKRCPPIVHLLFSLRKLQWNLLWSTFFVFYKREWCLHVSSLTYFYFLQNRLHQLGWRDKKLSK